jgi:CHAT domain-containing protein
MTLNKMTLNKKPASAADGLSMLMLANSASAELQDGTNQSTNLSSLINVRSEALEIAELWSNRGDVLSLLDEQASKTNFLAAQPERFGIMHFASHAVVNWQHPAHSAIKLASHDSQDPFAYPDLTFSDVSQMNINAELVVLAACETARGKNISGEGPIGLSRAFFEAGAKRVIASLWPVEDDSTASLLKEFYHQLAQGKNPVEALHSAQRYLQSHPSYSHPYYWAGFIFVGAADNWPQL